MKNRTKPIPESEVRIISGRWRGRKIHFPCQSGLRPTPDRVRETVFNWLAPYIVDARCLDLFAGSGALGFEALSRGASAVVWVEHSSQAVSALRNNLQRFINSSDDGMTEIYPATFSKNLHLNSQPFDIVFLDPPFKQNLLPACYEWLQAEEMLAPSALIYIETEKPLDELALPKKWQVIRDKKAGHVYYYLVRIDATEPQN